MVPYKKLPRWVVACEQRWFSCLFHTAGRNGVVKTKAGKSFVFKRLHEWAGTPTNKKISPESLILQRKMVYTTSTEKKQLTLMPKIKKVNKLTIMRTIVSVSGNTSILFR